MSDVAQQAASSASAPTLSRKGPAASSAEPSDPPRGRATASPRARRIAVDRTIDLVGVTGTGAHGRILARDVERATVGPARRGRITASPLARRIARERGIDLAAVSGTGPNGRIVADDVERTATGVPAPAVAAAAPAAPALRPVAPGEVQVVKLSGIRRTIARRLTEAWQAPAFQISMSADMEQAQLIRAGLVARTPEGGVKPTVGDVVTKLVAVALMRHPQVNALFAGDEIHLYGNANIGIAVAAPQGLLVPVIPAAEQRSIGEIAVIRADLAAKARAGKLTAEEMQGGTFSISNLGMFGVETFIAVLNPPQAAILAVGAIQDTPVARDGQVVIRPMLSITLTCDHRVIDGSVAAEFLETVKDFLEQPGLTL